MAWKNVGVCPRCWSLHFTAKMYPRHGELQSLQGKKVKQCGQCGLWFTQPLVVTQEELMLRHKRLAGGSNAGA